MPIRPIDTVEFLWLKFKPPSSVTVPLCASFIVVSLKQFFYYCDVYLTLLHIYFLYVLWWKVGKLQFLLDKVTVKLLDIK